MTTLKHRPKFYSLIIKLLLVFNILLFVFSVTWMFITSEAYSIFAYGILATYGLLSAIGFTLIQRWHKAGLWVVLGVNIIMASILTKMFSTWLFETFGYYGGFVPIIVSIAIVLLTAIPLFVVKSKPLNKSIWNVMDVGLDFKHFRHIYQLTIILLVGVGTIMLFKKPVLDVDKVEDHRNESMENITREINYTLLDSTNVTLNDIAAIESMIDSFPQQSQLIYNRRIFALKHVILSGLMADNHSTLNLINICKVHAGDFSPQQQEILDWYVSLSQPEQEIWLDCPSVDNLLSFEKELKQRLSTKRNEK